MAQPNYNRDKRQREIAKKKKQEEKRQRRMEKRKPDEPGKGDPPVRESGI
jgi:hypothetical protein